MKWLHKLFNPHCEVCRQEAIADKECASCTTLIRQLELAQHEREKLIEALIRKELPIQQQIQVQENLRPVSNGKIPWKVQQAKLERESKIEAERIRQLLEDEEKKPAITKIELSKIEKEIGLDDASRNISENVS